MNPTHYIEKARSSKTSLTRNIRWWGIFILTAITAIIINYFAWNSSRVIKRETAKIEVTEFIKQKAFVQKNVDFAQRFIQLELNYLKHQLEPNQDFEKLFSQKYLKHDFPAGSKDLHTQLMVKDARTRILSLLSKYQFSNDGYIFALDFNGDILVINYKTYDDGTKLWDLSPNKESEMKATFQKLLLAGQKAKGSFTDYRFTKLNNQGKLMDKTSYIVGIPKISWFLGGGIYKEDIKTQIINLKSEIKTKFVKDLINLIILYLILVIFFLIIADLLSKRIVKDYKHLIDFFENNSNDSNIIDRGEITFSEMDIVAENANKMHLARMQAENALYNEKAELLETIESIQSGVITTDKLGNILLMNQVALKICGWQEYQNKTISEIGTFHQSSSQKQIPNPVIEVLHKKKNVKKTYGYQLKNSVDSTIHLSFSASALQNSQQELFGAVFVFQDTSKDYHLKEALKESERRYRKLLHTTNEGFVQFDNKLRITDLNQTLCEMINLKRNDAIGKNILDLIILENNAEDRLLLQKIDHQEEIFNEFKVRVSDTSKLSQVLINATPTHDENNEVSGYFAFITDISQLKSIEQALKRSEDYLLSIFNAMTDILLELDSEGKYLYIAPTSPKLLILPPAELLGKTVSEVMDIEVATMVNNAIRKTIADKKIHTLEYPLEINGEITWFEARTAPKTDNSVLFIGRDITEQKEAEARLVASEKRYKYLFDQSPSSTWEEDFSTVKLYLNDLQTKGVTDLKEYFKEHPEEIGVCTKKVKIVDVNRKTLEIYGTKNKSELIASLNKFFNPEADMNFIDHLLSIANNELFYSAETVNRTMDGKIIDIQLLANVVPGYEKDYSKVLVSVIDITKQKRRDKQIALDLQEKNTLLKELYHRTKNNMQIISSMLKIQSQNIQDEYILSTFKNINNKIQSMSLVHQKLYQSRNLSQINLKDYIINLVSLLIQSYHVNSNIITVEYDLDDVNIMMDSAIPLGLCLNELITNSFKYAFKPEEQGKLLISLHQTENNIILQIGDTGNNIPIDFAPKTLSTMGLKTVISLIENQLKGTIDYEIQEGLVWKISFQDNLHSNRI